jgi:hypothetical protein
MAGCDQYAVVRKSRFSVERITATGQERKSGGEKNRHADKRGQEYRHGLHGLIWVIEKLATGQFLKDRPGFLGNG